LRFSARVEQSIHSRRGGDRPLVTRIIACSRKDLGST
jgi:hypothetical protein